MISTQAESVRELLNRYTQLELDRALDKVLTHRADELAVSTDELESPAKRAILLREREWLRSRELPTGDIGKAHEQIDKIIELLPTDPAGINKPAGQLEKTLKKVVEKLEVATEKAWVDVVKLKRPSVDESVLKQLEHFEAMIETINRIRVLAKHPSDVQAPLDRDALTAIENRWQELGELLETLPKSTENPDVKRFLTAVNKGGAPLSLLTDSVITYLKAIKQLESFRIYHSK